MEELFPLVNEQGDLVGKATRAYCHSGSFVLHPVVHLHVFNSEGQLYLQKRSMDKDIQPGMWDTSVGGHVDFREIELHATEGADHVQFYPFWVQTALEREAREELGMTAFTAHFVTRYDFRSPFERELVHTFFTIWDNPLVPDPDEISEGRFWDIAEIKANLGKEIFTPNFEGEFLSVLQTYENQLNQG